jgi:hypothetical protein
MQERHEAYMKRRLKEEKIGVNVEFNNMRLTEEIEEIKENIKKLQIDISYIMQKYG